MKKIEQIFVVYDPDGEFLGFTLSKDELREKYPEAYNSKYYDTINRLKPFSYMKWLNNED